MNQCVLFLVQHFPRYDMMHESDWQVVIDTVHLSEVSLGKRYSALEIKPHPNFSEENNDYDLGLLRTAKDMEMGGEGRDERDIMGPFL